MLAVQRDRTRLKRKKIGNMQFLMVYWMWSSWVSLNAWNSIEEGNLERGVEDFGPKFFAAIRGYASLVNC